MAGDCRPRCRMRAHRRLMSSSEFDAPRRYGVPFPDHNYSPHGKYWNSSVIVVLGLELFGCTQLGAASPGILYVLRYRRHDRLRCQNAQSGPMAAPTDRHLRWTDAVAAFLPQKLFHNSVFQRMEADNDQSSAGLQKL